MQIKSLKISNILSFAYYEKVSLLPEIVFSSKTHNGGIDILIGPNGSGKSNFIEVLNHVFKGGIFKDFLFNKDILYKKDVHHYQKVISLRKDALRIIKKHLSYQDKPSFVEVVVALSRYDRENIQSILDNKEVIKQLIKKYSLFAINTLDTDFPSIIIPEEISLSFTLQEGHIVLKRVDHSPIYAFFYDYLEYFELFQRVIEIYNEFDRQGTTQPLHELKNTFGIIGSFRSFSNLNGRFELESSQRISQSILQIEDTIFYTDTKSQFFEPLGFELAKKKLTLLFEKYLREAWNLGEKKIHQYAQQKLLEDPLFDRLNRFLMDFLSVRLEIWRLDEQHYEFSLIDIDNNRLHFNDLSSGEKSIVLILFSIYGYDLENGVVIIDEPEIHLHPQFQKQFLKLLDQICEQLSLQFILATHSPLMINENNIPYVSRFYLKDNATHVVAASGLLQSSEARLSQILTFSNASKIFFVDKIIMVEGETDEYFFSFYLNYLSTQYQRHKYITNYEIININGKGGLKRRSEFLKKFGIQHYFIGDWDNVQDTGIIIDMDMFGHLDEQKTRTLSRPARRPFKKKKAKIAKYAQMVEMIKKNYPNNWKDIERDIESLYQKKTFILKGGDIEAYLGLPDKGLDVTIEFCNERFQSWLHDKNYDSKRREFEEIFRRIFIENRE